MSILKWNFFQCTPLFTERNFFRSWQSWNLVILFFCGCYQSISCPRDLQWQIFRSFWLLVLGLRYDHFKVCFDFLHFPLHRKTTTVFKISMFLDFCPTRVFGPFKVKKFNPKTKSSLMEAQKISGGKISKFRSYRFFNNWVVTFFCKIWSRYFKNCRRM